MNKSPIQYFNAEDVIDSLPAIAKNGGAELCIYDKNIAKDKQKLIRLFTAIAKTDADIFLSITVHLDCIDHELLRAASRTDYSLDIPLSHTVSKKKAESVSQKLNQAEAVFGFDMDFAQAGDSFKLFKDRLDFALSLYPNHITFLPLEADTPIKPTGTFSSKEIAYAKRIAFACKTFYTCGRAVPWFSAVLRPLKIAPHAFFADFSEWEQCNNCAQETGFSPEKISHTELEKMQLIFLRCKYEEKHREELFSAARDLIRIHGAFSRIAANEEDDCTIELSYLPDDILSPQVFHLQRFADTVTMQPVRVHIFRGSEYPEYKIIC